MNDTSLRMSASRGRPCVNNTLWFTRDSKEIVVVGKDFFEIFLLGLESSLNLTLRIVKIDSREIEAKGMSYWKMNELLSNSCRRKYVFVRLET